GQKKPASTRVALCSWRTTIRALRRLSASSSASSSSLASPLSCSRTLVRWSSLSWMERGFEVNTSSFETSWANWLFGLGPNPPVLPPPPLVPPAILPPPGPVLPPGGPPPPLYTLLG